MFSVLILVFVLATHMKPSETSGTGEIMFTSFSYTGDCGGSSTSCYLFFDDITVIGEDGEEQALETVRTTVAGSGKVNLTTLLPNPTSVKLTGETLVKVSMKVYEVLEKQHELLSEGKTTNASYGSNSYDKQGDDSGKAVDGDTSGCHNPDKTCTHSAGASNNWWMVDLEAAAVVSKVKIYNRRDSNKQRIGGAKVFVDDTLCDTITYNEDEPNKVYELDCRGMVGNTVKVSQSNNFLTLCEVQVYGRLNHCVQKNTDFPGADIGTVSGVPNFDTCLNRCANNALCVSVTYNPSTRNCFPKNKKNGDGPQDRTGFNSRNLFCVHDVIMEIDEEAVVFNRVVPGNNWINEVYTSDSTASQLTISSRIASCDEHYSGEGCNSCVENYYTADCSVYCEDVPGRYSCTEDGTKTKVCEGHWAGAECDQCATYYYTKTSGCNRHCAPVADKYTCTGDGTKDCEGNWSGTVCNECVTDYHGAECDVFCSQREYYNCSDNGTKICSDKTASPEDHCRRQPGWLNVKVIGGAGGGALFLIVTLTTLCLVRRRAVKQQQDTQVANPTYHADDATVEMASQDPVYSMANRHRREYRAADDDVDDEEETTYADLTFVKSGASREERKPPEVPVNTAIYADISVREEDTTVRGGEGEDGVTYADLDFVKKTRGRGRGDEASMHEDSLQRIRETRRETADVTYTTVTQLKEVR